MDVFQQVILAEILLPTPAWDETKNMHVRVKEHEINDSCVLRWPGELSQGEMPAFLGKIKGSVTLYFAIISHHYSW